MTFLRSPYFIAAALFFILGCFGIAISWMTGLMLLVIAFLIGFTGVTVGVMRNRQATRSGGPVHLHE